MFRNKLNSLIDLLKESFSEWKEDNASRLAASLSYYTTFSMAPLLVLIIAIGGLLGGREAVQNEVLAQAQGMLGEEGMLFIKSMLEAASQPQKGVLAGVLGGIALILGALGVFAELQQSLNTIWEVKPKPVQGLTQGVWRFIKQRILSFSMVLAIGFVLLVSLAVNAGLSAMGDIVWRSASMPEVITHIINFLASFIIITILFALMFKFLPDAEISWRDVWLGAGVTALFFNLGKFAIGYYLGRSQVATTFGAAGSLALLLIWVYYSAQILFFGAEITQVYANEYGSRIVPDEDAVKLTEDERTSQGIPHQRKVEQEMEKEKSFRAVPK